MALRRGRFTWKNVNILGGIQQAAGAGIIVVLTAGVIAGAVCANLMDGASNESVRSFITDFFSTFDKTAINARASFTASVYKYARIIAVLWVSGLFMPGGAAATVCVLLFKAFAYGFTTAALVRYFGLYGLVVGFGGYVPQNLFFLPAMLLVAYNAVLTPGQLVFKPGKGGKGIVEYFLILVVGLLCCAVASLIETFITPALIEYIMPV